MTSLPCTPKPMLSPAYCVTEQGTFVYGAYFTTAGAVRVKSFPTRVKSFYKYTNVTALVRANKGLFLPITGRRASLSPEIGYRDMLSILGAYGQYMTSTSITAGLSRDFFFGPTEWNLSAMVRLSLRLSALFGYQVRKIQTTTCTRPGL